MQGCEAVQKTASFLEASPPRNKAIFDHTLMLPNFKYQAVQIDDRV